MPVAGKRVLIIDDSEIALQVIRDTLIELDCKVRSTDSPQEFLRLARGTPAPELILTDIEMPAMSGAEICRMLKSDPQTADIPVVIVSTQPNMRLVKLANTLGAQGYLCKANFDNDSIKAAIEPFLS